MDGSVIQSVLNTLVDSIEESEKREPTTTIEQVFDDDNDGIPDNLDKNQGDDNNDGILSKEDSVSLDEMGCDCVIKGNCIACVFEMIHGTPYIGE